GDRGGRRSSGCWPCRLLLPTRVSFLILSREGEAGPTFFAHLRRHEPSAAKNGVSGCADTVPFGSLIVAASIRRRRSPRGRKGAVPWVRAACIRRVSVALARAPGQARHLPYAKRCPTRRHATAPGEELAHGERKLLSKR